MPGGVGYAATREEGGSMADKKRREAGGSEWIPLSEAAKLLRLDEHEVNKDAHASIVKGANG
jgi:hypothetical protein